MSQLSKPLDGRNQGPPAQHVDRREVRKRLLKMILKNEARRRAKRK